MTQNYFTAIVNGDARKNDAAIWNDPLGELDAQLGILNSQDQVLQDTLDNIILDDGTGNAEVIAARTAINYKAGAAPATLAATMGYAAGDTYNVKAYGATGDGSTDDRAAVQAAIDAAYAAGGGVVFLPKGVYYLSSTSGRCLAMNHNVTLRGVGPATVLDFHGLKGEVCVEMSGTNDAAVEKLLIRNAMAITANTAISSSATTNRMRVRGVVVRGNTITKTISTIVGNGTTMTCTATAHGFSTGDNVYVYGTGVAQNVNTTLEILWDNITVTNANTFTKSSTRVNSASAGVAQKITWNNGIYVNGADALVEDCDIATGFYVGIRQGPNATRAKVTHCTLTDGMRGVMFDAGTPGAAYCIVTHSHFYQNKQAATKIEDTCVHNLFADNTIIDCGLLAYNGAIVEILGPYSTVERNHLYFSSATADSESAIDVTSTTPGHICIRNNTIEGHTEIGINIANGVNYFEISGNQIHGGTTGIRIDGTGTGALMCTNFTISNNRISNVANYGVTLQSCKNFILQNNVIVNVTTLNGVRLVEHNSYGAIIGNLIMNTGADGFVQLNSTNPGSYISLVGNVIRDNGNLSGTGYSMGFSQNIPKLAVVGNICDDAPDANYSIRGASVASVAAVGNACEKSTSFSGTTVSSANNI